MSGLMSLIGPCIHPDNSGKLCFLSVLQGCRNGERKIKEYVAYMLCVLVTYPSQLWDLKGKGRKQVKSVVLRGSQQMEC